MSYHEMDDGQLWVLLLEKNSEALKVVYYRNYDLLLNYGYKICRNDELVKDCIHDIFLKIFGNKKLSLVDQIRPYLIRSLRNMITEELTKKGVINLVEFDINSILTMDALSVEINDDIDDNELKKSQRLRFALLKLNNNQKQILYLRYVKDLSFKEVADCLDINVQSAMNLASRVTTQHYCFINHYLPRQGLPRKDFDYSFWQFAR